jgi:hypothetical protein
VLKTETPISRFLALYARETAKDNLPAVVSHFADTFLFAGPSGAQPVRVSDFAAALPERKALFDQLGSEPPELTAIRETPLDSRYVLARTTWRFSFKRDNSPAQHFETESTFLIDTGMSGTREADFKILLYLPHQDILRLMKDRGILQP